jgi:hypothetical protein
MIAQSFPLYALDGGGGLHVVVGWVGCSGGLAKERGVSSEVSPVVPVLIDASGYLNPLGAMVWPTPVRYFGDWDTAVRHSNGNFWRPE